MLVEFFIAVLLNCILNFYWSYLIMMQVYRVLTRGGSDDKEFSKDAREFDEKNEEGAKK